MSIVAGTPGDLHVSSREEVAAAREGLTRWRRIGIVWLIRVVVCGVIVGAWQLVADYRILNPAFIGVPSGIVSALFALPATTFTVDLLTTLSETVIAFAIGSVTGMVFGALLARSALLDRALRPIFGALNSTPRIAFAPLFILWFGLGEPSKIALGVSLVFFVVAANTRAALTGLDRDILLLARALGASEFDRLVRFVLPGAVPTLMAGLELGLAYSFLGTVAGEIMGGAHGLGVVLSYDANTFRTNEFFAVLVVLGLVTVVLLAVVRFVGRRASRWHSVEMRGEG